MNKVKKIENIKSWVASIFVFLIWGFACVVLILLSFISLDIENGSILINQAPEKEKVERIAGSQTKNLNTLRWSFISNENNMGALAINLGDTGMTVFRLRNSNNYLYYQNGFSVDKFEVNKFTTFDFPKIVHSKGKKYIVEVEYATDKSIALLQTKSIFIQQNKYTYQEFFSGKYFSIDDLYSKLIYYINNNLETRVFIFCYFIFIIFYFINKKIDNIIFRYFQLLFLIVSGLTIALLGINSQIVLIIALLLFAIPCIGINSSHTFAIGLVYLLIGIIFFKDYNSQLGSKLALISYLHLIIGAIYSFFEILFKIKVNSNRLKLILPNYKDGQKDGQNFYFIDFNDVLKKFTNSKLLRKYSHLKINYFLISDILFIFAIVLIVQYFTQFRWDSYLFTGDFRFNIYNNIRGDQYLSLISKQFSSNNFIYLPFYSIFFIFQFIQYKYIVFYLIHGLPVLLFLSMKFVLLKIAHYRRKIFTVYLFISSVAFYFAINPALFLRYVHWTKLHSFMLLPIFIYFAFIYFQRPKNFSYVFYMLPIILYFGAMDPHGIIVYTFASIFIYFLTFVIYKPSFIRYLFKGIIFSFIYILSFIHIIFPILIGYGQAKSVLESATKSYFLDYFSRYSNIYSAISGTNFFDQLILYPSYLSTGFFIFIAIIVIFIFFKLNNRINLVLFSFILPILIVITGYGSFNYIYDFLNSTYVHNYLWLIKDPNMYYLVFLCLICFLFSRIVVFSNFRKSYILILSFIIIFSNVYFILHSDKSKFNSDFRFVNFPDSYLKLSSLLAKDEGRNFWYPNNVYVSTNYSKDIRCYPSAKLWLTQNKELYNYLTPDYKNLVKLISTEIYDKQCKNINFLNWIVASQSLNVILDKNNVNTLNCPPDNTGEKVKIAAACMSKLPNIYKYKSIGNVDVYKSDLKINKKLYSYQGNVDGLDKFLKNEPVNIIYTQANSEKIAKIDIRDFTILNESFDKHWLDDSNKPSVYKVNFASMLFTGSNPKFYYRGESDFQNVVFVQKIILALSIIILIILVIKKIVKKKNEK